MRRIVRLRPFTVRCIQFLGLVILLQSLRDLLPSSSTPDNHSAKGKKEKVFIASIHWNNEYILRRHWVPAVVELTKAFGPENVYLSVQESGSWDDSKGALKELDALLEKENIPHKIILDDTTHLDEINRPPSETGWIDTPRGKTELRRIPYLARLRNLVLEPLQQLARDGQRFDKILFINDVVFEVGDVQRLIDTRNGEYAAACSLDFAKPPKFYDTFALRDAEGHDKLMQTWPYFRARASRRALKAGQPVPVKSCWNGIVVFNAEPFYDADQPLRFRGIPDSLAMLHLEGSECCLIHADNRLTPSKGVWLNPNVRVGYNRNAYETMNPRNGAKLMSTKQVAYACWENRLRRWFTFHIFKEMIVWRRLWSWQHLHSGRQERGVACLINEMQVLVHNGWAHV